MQYAKHNSKFVGLKLAGFTEISEEQKLSVGVVDQR
jgi:hypothetical protein